MSKAELPAEAHLLPAILRPILDSIFLPLDHPAQMRLLEPSIENGNAEVVNWRCLLQKSLSGGLARDTILLTLRKRSESFKCAGI